MKERRFQKIPMLEQERDEQPPDAAVAIEVGVDGLELHVREADPYERGKLVLGVQVLLDGKGSYTEEARRDGFSRHCQWPGRE
jgi:hypothetical protein